MYSKKDKPSAEYIEAKRNLLGYIALLYEIKREVDSKDLSPSGDNSVGSTTVAEAAPIAAPERR